MKNLFITRKLSFVAVICALTFLNGCQPDDEDLQEATFPNIADIFTDVPVNLTDQFFVSFDPNAGANTNGFGTDNNIAFEGNTSIRIDVPSPNDPNGNFIGGIFLDRGEGRNLTSYNSLSFYALSSTTATITVGFGTDFETDSFAVSTDIELRTGWNKYVIPVPNANRLVQERGMFLFAAGSGSTNGFGYTFWLDEMRFEDSNFVSQNGSLIQGGQNQVTAANAGSTITISDTLSEFNVTDVTANNSQLITLNTAPGYFDYTSSNEAVATVDELGVVSILSDQGSAVITASLDGITALGSITIMEADGSDNVDDSGNSQVMLPLGFESSTLAYNPVEFGGAPSAVVANPMIGGLNNSTNVLSTQKVVGSEPFAGIIMDIEVPVDFSEQQQVSALVFSPAAGTTVLLGFEDSNIPGAPSPSQIAVTETTTVANQWQELIFDFTGLTDNAVDYNRMVLIYNNGTPGDNSLFYIDDIRQVGDSDGGGDDPNNPDNLLENGDFEQGMVTWFGNAFNVVEDGGNSFNQSDNEISANSFDVNLSHPVELAAGTTYTLSFDAATSAADASRTIIAGIGLNEADFASSTETVTITADLQNYTLTLTPPSGSANSRVLFDLGADDGLLVIDNVVLTIESTTTGGDELLTNGDFEQGMVTWFGNAFNVIEDGGNSFNQSDNEISANSFDVNLSHPVELTAGASYTLSFDAGTSAADVSRTIIAGIGLNEGGFEADIETVTITSTLQNYTLTLSPPAGSANSRVLFDLGSDDGVLVIDNVSLVLN